MAIDTTSPRTRRVILIGALGATAAAAASALGRSGSVLAADNDAVLVGNTYSATAPTEIDATGTDALVGTSDLGFGVHGSSDQYIGVFGESTSWVGAFGESATNIGVFGRTEATDKPATVGFSGGQSTGVFGYSSDGSDELPAARAKTGVLGIANEDAKAVGVRGESTTGRGGTFKGKLAQLNLAPSTAATHPASGSAGDLFVDSTKRLWFCKGATTWVRLA